MVSFAGVSFFCNADSTVLDNAIFRLHYKFTVIILLVFSLLIAIKQYISDPIDCTTKDDIPSGLLDNFCWVHPTFSLPGSWKKSVGNEIPYPGIDAHTPGEEKVYHVYYQWVFYMLFTQAVLFYIPRYFWKSMEGGKIKKMISGLENPMSPEEFTADKRMLVVGYIASNMNKHKFYFLSYAVAEILNFINVLGQIFLMDAFLSGQFLGYGLSVAEFSNWKWSIQYDPMLRVFPRLTKCSFYRFGTSGDTQRHDALCILPLNIIYEKIYLFLWFWFFILLILSGIVLVYRILIICIPKFRVMVTRFKTQLDNDEELQVILKKGNIGDWLVFDLLSKNLDSLVFRNIIKDYARKLDG